MLAPHPMFPLLNRRLLSLHRIRRSHRPPTHFTYHCAPHHSSPPLIITTTANDYRPPNREAVHVMLDADVSGAPVVDAEGRLVGVLTEKDLIWKVRRAGLISSIFASCGVERAAACTSNRRHPSKVTTLPSFSSPHFPHPPSPPPPPPNPTGCRGPPGPLHHSAGLHRLRGGDSVAEGQPRVPGGGTQDPGQDGEGVGMGGSGGGVLVVCSECSECRCMSPNRSKSPPTERPPPNKTPSPTPTGVRSDGQGPPHQRDPLHPHERRGAADAQARLQPAARDRGRRGGGGGHAARRAAGAVLGPLAVFGVDGALWAFWGPAWGCLEDGCWVLRWLKRRGRAATAVDWCIL